MPQREPAFADGSSPEPLHRHPLFQARPGFICLPRLQLCYSETRLDLRAISIA